MFKNSNTNKRYYTLDYYYKQRYGKKVFKVSLNLNLTCPNIDGTKSYGGCIYCKNGSGEDKKAYVTELLKAWIKKTGLSMTDEQLSILIEGIFAELDCITVNTYKQEKSK